MSASILVVEDEPSIQELIAVGLKRSGHAVRGAFTAEEAYGAVAEALPDVILLDWMLPDASGPSLARRLRAGSPHPRGPDHHAHRPRRRRRQGRGAGSGRRRLRDQALLAA
jgi:CheY-like chemotaxis protein